jgi:hypothetical protein
MQKLCALLLMAILFNMDASAQALSTYLGGGISYDPFLRNKQVMPNKPDSRILLSPQFVAGLRYYTAQNFNLMLDVTLGISRFNMPVKTPNIQKFYYEQIRSLITVGSGLYMEIDEEQSFMPYVQLGVGFYDFSDMTEKVPTGYVGIQTDYNSKRFIPVCGVGFEYTFRMVAMSAINVRALYTPVDIFPEPVKYGVDGINKTGPYELQGKLLQFLVTYQINIPIIKRQYY